MNSKKSLKLTAGFDGTPTSYDNQINYKYNEGQLVADLQKYVDATYGEHYSTNQFQATEFIIDGGHGEGFCIGNIMKYAQRYGKKEGHNKADLMKVIHYAMIQLSQDHYQE